MAALPRLGAPVVDRPPARPGLPRRRAARGQRRRPQRHLVDHLLHRDPPRHRPAGGAVRSGARRARRRRRDHATGPSSHRSRPLQRRRVPPGGHQRVRRRRPREASTRQRRGHALARRARRNADRAAGQYVAGHGGRARTAPSHAGGHRGPTRGTHPRRRVRQRVRGAHRLSGDLEDAGGVAHRAGGQPRPRRPLLGVLRPAARTARHGGAHRREPHGREVGAAGRGTTRGQGR